MSRSFEKNRPRLLVVCRNPAVRNDLVTLLTGYGYYVDYESSRQAGIESFQEHKQPIVILDVPALTPSPARVFRLFRVYRRNPVLLIAASKEEEARIYPYMRSGVYDIVQLPLRTEYLQFILRRLMEHSRLMNQNEFFGYVLAIIIAFAPVWMALLFFFVH